MYIILFHSVSDALFLEKLTQKNQSYHCEIIPVPRELSSSCGYAVKVLVPNLEDIKQLMIDYDIEWEAIYQKEQDSYLLL